MNAFTRFFSSVLLVIVSFSGCTEDKTYITNNPPTDQRPPTVEWVSINSGVDFQSAVHDTVEIVFVARDTSGIDSARLYLDGALLASLTPPPTPPASGGEYQFSFLWNTLSDSDGVHTLVAVAYDKAGNLGTTPAPLTLRVSNTTPPPPPDRTPPVITWLSPVAGSIVRNTTEFRFIVTDSSLIDSLKVYVDGEVAVILAGREDSLYTVSWNSWRWTNGRKIVNVRAWDNAGNVGLSELVGVTVDNHRVIWVPDDYEKIQDAINASVDGDTVRVRDGVYPEGLDLLRKRIWLESENGPDRTIIDAASRVNGMRLYGGQDTSLMIRGFTITSAYFGIYFDNGCSARLYNNIIVRSDQANIEAWENQSIMINNVFADNNPERYNVELYYSYGRFENNLLVRSGRFALYNYCIDENPLIPEYNLFWLYDQLMDPNPGFRLAGNNLIDINPLISDTLFHLLPQSPCINAGNPELRDPDGTRSDIGAYGGPYAYRQMP